MTVTSKRLGNKNLQSVIPTEMFLLQNLEQLWLRSNDVSMKFKDVENAKSLRMLYLNVMWSST